MSMHLDECALAAAALATLLFGCADALAAPAGARKPESAPAFVPDASMPRDAIPAEFQWDPKPLFASDAECEAGLRQAAGLRERLATYRGRLAEPTTLQEALALYFDLRLLTNRITLYANLRFDTAQTSAALQTLNERGVQAMNALIATAGFIRLEVLAQSDEAMAAAYQAAPGLASYRPYLEQLRRRRAHVLSADTERVLALVGDNLFAEIDLNELPSDFERVYQAQRTDLPLPTIQDEGGRAVPLTLSNFPKYRASANREVRRAAVQGMFAALRSQQHVFAAALAGQIRFNVFLARARGYDTALAAYLDRDEIDPAVYHNLIAAVRQNLAPLQRYLRLRKHILGVAELHLYDLYTPLANGVDMKVPYAEAQRLLPAALRPLGADYERVLQQALRPGSGWIDLYPHADKASGAFSASVFGVHPFVKMNYFEEIDDLSTLAHELGHALHSHLSMQAQPYVTAGYVPFLAEIASTFNEKLLADHLLATVAGDAERLYLLAEHAETLRTTVYRQTLFAEFELRVHTAAEAGTPLTAEFLNDTYAGLLRDYYGPDLVIDADDPVEWAYIPHFFYKYYVFSYATGLSAAVALAERVTQGGAAAQRAYLGMLAGGCTKPPLELLRAAGADLTRPEPIAAAAHELDRTLGEIERLVQRTR